MQPPDWWLQFWSDYEAHFHVSRQVAIERLHKLLGMEYQSRPVTALYLRDLLRK